MAQRPLQILETLDPQLLKLHESSSKLALGDGALPRKYKFLILMALDAAHGATHGVRTLAQGAMQVGATKEEVIEALRVAYHAGGAGSLHTAAQALRELFPPK